MTGGGGLWPENTLSKREGPPYPAAPHRKDSRIPRQVPHQWDTGVGEDLLGSDVTAVPCPAVETRWYLLVFLLGW